MPFAFRFILVVMILELPVNSLRGQEKVYEYVDLQDRWRVWDDADYRSFLPSRDRGSKVIYLPIRAEDDGTGVLQVNSRYYKALFVNGKLHSVARDKIAVNIGELRTHFHSKELLIAVYQEHINTGNLETKILLDESRSQLLSGAHILRPRTYFHDFVITVTIFLLVFLVVITRLTKLSLRYFSIKRIFSSYESDDPQLYIRVISGSNILFYFFCSLVLSFYLMIIFHYVPDQFILAWSFKSSSFSDAWFQWATLSLLLLLFFLLRIFLIFLVSRLYNLRETFGFQIINWIRMMLIVFGLLGVTLMVYSISRGVHSDVYITFYWLILVVLIAWCIVLFMKVTRRSGFSLLHIFSYLCVTEIIPLLVTVKFLFQ